MIRWLVQSVADNPALTAGRPPVGLLNAAELQHYNGYYSPRRRRDWLLGRWTAKRLIQAELAARLGFTPELTWFGIAQDPNGAPYVYSHHPALALSGAASEPDAPACGQARVPICLSISHSHGYAFCAVMPMQEGNRCLGADIELVETPSATFADDFFTTGERSHLAACPPELYPLMLYATWSAKEAALKAVQVGLRADPRNVECWLRPGHPRMWTPLRIDLQPTLRAAAPQAFRGWWRVMGNRLRPGTHFVLTLVSQAIPL